MGRRISRGTEARSCLAKLHASRLEAGGSGSRLCRAPLEARQLQNTPETRDFLFYLERSCRAGPLVCLADLSRVRWSSTTHKSTLEPYATGKSTQSSSFGLCTVLTRAVQSATHAREGFWAGLRKEQHADLAGRHGGHEARRSSRSPPISLRGREYTSGIQDRGCKSIRPNRVIPMPLTGNPCLLREAETKNPWPNGQTLRLLQAPPRAVRAATAAASSAHDSRPCSTGCPLSKSGFLGFLRVLENDRRLSIRRFTCSTFQELIFRQRKPMKAILSTTWHSNVHRRYQHTSTTQAPPPKAGALRLKGLHKSFDIEDSDHCLAPTSSQGKSPTK